MSEPSLCQNCQQHAATVFLTQIVENQTSQRRLCEECARNMAAHNGLIDLPGLPDSAAEALSEALQQLPLDDIMRSLFGEGGPFGSENGAFEGAHDEAPAWFDAEDNDADANPDSAWDAPDDEDAAQQDAFEALMSEAAPDARCPKCDTTWDRLKQDGRAGCAQCYETFGERLREVMGRLQRGEAHVGKAPRAREKRRRRLEHLRQKRDNRLEMLGSRLADAVREERYEDAALLRDKIRVVSSTIVRDDV